MSIPQGPTHETPSERVYPLKSQVEIASSIQAARAAEATAVHGDPYKELMANYVVWGELLEAWNRGELEMSDDEFEEQCSDYLERSIVLGKAIDVYNAQCWAVAFNAITTDEVA